MKLLLRVVLSGFVIPTLTLSVAADIDLRPYVEARLANLLDRETTNFTQLSVANGRLFCLRSQSPAQQPVLVTSDSLTNLAHLRVLAGTGGADSNRSSVIQWYLPSPGGDQVAVCLREETAASIVFFETRTGRNLGEVLPTVDRSGQISAAWNGAGVFYTRPVPANGSSTAMARLFFHALGTAATQDRAEPGLPAALDCHVQSSPDGGWFAASLQLAPEHFPAWFLKRSDGPWRQIARLEDEVSHVQFGRDPLYLEAGADESIYLLSFHGAARGRILRLPLAAADLKNATLEVPEGKSLIESFQTSASGLALKLRSDSGSMLAFHDFFDRRLHSVTDHSFSEIDETFVSPGDTVWYRESSFLQAGRWSEYKGSQDRPRPEATPLADRSAADFGDAELTQELLDAADGSKIHLVILHKKGLRLTGNNPGVLEDASCRSGILPFFEAARRLWLDQGGFFALADLEPGNRPGRTGGEAANAFQMVPRASRCAEFLIRSGYTSEPKLAFLTEGSEVEPTRRALAQTKAPIGTVLPRSAQGESASPRLRHWTDLFMSLMDRLGVDFSLIDRGPLCGELAPRSITVKTKLLAPGMRARAVASKPGAEPIYSKQELATEASDRVVELSLTNLEPNCSYSYMLEVEGRLERGKQGSFRTLPAPGPASFKFAFASCARTGSTSDVFDRIREHQPLFFIHMGDFHYLDIQTNSRTRFRAAYDSVLASPEQADCYRHVPLVYMWDDHDFGGNNSNRRAPSHEAARLTYEEVVPHYPLVFDRDGPLSQSFSVGRVKFILTDLRSQRDPAQTRDSRAKSMLGPEQKQWFKEELLAAKGRYPLICWVSTVPWIGTAGTHVYRGVASNQFGYIHHSTLHASPVDSSSTNAAGAISSAAAAPAPLEDHWSVFPTERRELADFIKANHITGLCILHGDSHMLAADDGSHSDYATGGGAPIPVMCAAPLDQEPSIKGGPYSQGIYRVRKGEGCFGLIEVDDQGSQIVVRYSGRNNRDEEKISLQFSVPVTEANPLRPIPAQP